MPERQVVTASPEWGVKPACPELMDTAESEGSPASEVKEGPAEKQDCQGLMALLALTAPGGPQEKLVLAENPDPPALWVHQAIEVRQVLQEKVDLRVTPVPQGMMVPRDDLDCGGPGVQQGQRALQDLQRPKVSPVTMGSEALTAPPEPWVPEERPAPRESKAPRDSLVELVLQVLRERLDPQDPRGRQGTQVPQEVQVVQARQVSRGRRVGEGRRVTGECRECLGRWGLTDREDLKDPQDPPDPPALQGLLELRESRAPWGRQGDGAGRG